MGPVRDLHLQTCGVPFTLVQPQSVLSPTVKYAKGTTLLGNCARKTENWKPMAPRATIVDAARSQRGPCIFYCPPKRIFMADELFSCERHASCLIYMLLLKEETTLHSMLSGYVSAALTSCYKIQEQNIVVLCVPLVHLLAHGTVW